MTQKRIVRRFRCIQPFVGKVIKQSRTDEQKVENKLLSEVDNPTDEELKTGAQLTRLMRKFKKLKVFPTDENIVKHTSGSGTGFALTANGLIITNSHVVEGSNNITVKGVDGNFNKTYKAKLMAVDKNNDLAIIQIDEPSFKSFGNIPFTIQSKTSEVGTSIFVLGYPLRASMGDEIKLTNGIISSKSGYQGDITTYQISAPVQPGNSGGPMFDSKGNLIGVINAKLVGAENASYAIKTSYLLNLVETLSNVPKLQSVSSIGNKPLSDQVKVLKKFTYIIEVN